MKRPHRYDSPEFKGEAVCLVVEHNDRCAASGRRAGVKGEWIGRGKCEGEGMRQKPFSARVSPQPSSSVPMNPNGKNSGYK